jgi:hypothetical protein
MDPSPFQQIFDRETAQPTLWPDPDTLAMGDKFQAGQFTGERLAAQDPDRYRAICGALANGMSLRSIARAYQVSTNTVAAVREREGLTIETLKQRLADQARLGAGLAIERMIEEIDHFKRESLPIVAGVLIDKSQLLDGQPTQIHGQPEAPADWDAARQAIRQARGRTIDTAQETGLIPQSEQTKGSTPAGTLAALPEPGPMAGLATRDGVTPDLQSPVSLSTSKDSGAAGHGAGHDTARPRHAGDRHGTPPTNETTRGGGGSDAASAAATSIGSGAENFDTKETP